MIILYIFSDSEDSEHELVLNREPCLMEKVGLVEGALSELTHEHRIVVMVGNALSIIQIKCTQPSCHLRLRVYF